MGNLLGLQKKRSQKQQEIGESHHEIITLLKRKQIDDLLDVEEYLNEQYPQTTLFAREEFVDVFGILLDDRAESAFEIFRNAQGLCDKYEILAAMALLNGDDLEVRSNYIFRLFDFDRSRNIDLNEFVLSASSAINGLCKMVGQPTPQANQIEEYASDVYYENDQDQNNTLDIEEIRKYIIESEELQEFLFRYSNVNTFQLAEKKFRKIYYQLQEIYIATAKATGEKDFSRTDCYEFRNQVRTYYQKAGIKDYSQDNWKILLRYLQDVSRVFDKTIQKPRISLDAFQHVMRAWVAFDVCDADESDTIDLTELKFMLFCFDDFNKPDNWRVREEMDIIDKNKDATVSREEWIDSLCREQIGLYNFYYIVKNKFLKYDANKSGFLEKNELANLLLNQTFGEEHSTFDEAAAAAWQTHVEAILQELDLNRDGKISYPEFKLQIGQFYRRNKNTQAFINEQLGKLEA